MRFNYLAGSLLALILILSPSLSNTKLTIRWPQSLSKRFDKVNGIGYYVINPEYSTEKKSFIGNLVLAQPENGCRQIKSIHDGEISNPIAVVTAGDCSFAQKAKNAELAGAKMVLILTDNEDLQTYRQKQRDYPVHIETLIVDKTDGDILKNYLREQQGNISPSMMMMPEISYTLDVDKYINAQLRSNPVRIDYWYAASNLDGSSFSTLDALKSLILEVLSDHIVFTPHYVLWRDDSSTYIADYNERCLSGSRYCDPEPGDLNLGGGESVLENLRQLCLFQVSDNIDQAEYWWNYVIRFGKNCMSKKGADLESCRASSYDLAGIPSNMITQVDRCMRESFVGGVPGGSNTNLRKIRADNKLLKKEYEEQQEFDLITYPSIYVNDARYDGSLKDVELLRDFICDHFPTESIPPQSCSQKKIINTPIVQSESDFLVYLGMGLFSTLFMITLIYCVRRNIKREVMGKMNEEITTIVSQYTQVKINS